MTSLPSHARYRGSSPSIPQTPFTSGCTGTSAAFKRMPTLLWPAISYRTVPTPPLVASRITCRLCVVSMTAFTVFHKGAQSLVTSASMPKSSRSNRIVHPCRPISPVTMIASPGFASSPPTVTPSSISPIPVVVIKTPSTCPFPATFVSPDTICTPASFAVFSMAAAISSSFSIGNPSSITKAQVR